VRDRLRGEPGSDTDIDARRLGRSPAAEGLQRRRRSGPIQGKQQGDMTDTRDDQRSEDQKTVDIWATGTEEPPFDPTDEGSQEMGFDETQERLAEQFGRVISDDYMYEEEQLDDERMLLNMGPQHPSTHGVLRLQVELEGEVIRRTRPVIGYLHTGMEKTAETLTFMQGPTNVT